ncbi:MAG: DUF5050 domain-containing protein [Clostridiales bacterium]|nr:DUF5050 domain-containing protein [Clostridiales bacterium]
MKIRKHIILVMALIICLGILHGCSSNIDGGSNITVDLQSQRNCLVAESDGECFMINKEGICKFDPDTNQTVCIIAGKFKNICCNEKYIYCIELTPLPDEPCQDNGTLVRFDRSTLQKTVVADYTFSYTFVGDGIVFQYEPNWFYVLDHKRLKAHYGSLYRIGIDGRHKKLLVDEHVDMFWSLDGELWYGMKTGNIGAGSPLMKFYKYDRDKSKSVYMGSSYYEGFTASYGNLLFSPWIRDNKLIIWDALTSSETVLSAEYKTDDFEIYVFPVKYASAFEQDWVLYSSEEYFVVAIPENDDVWINSAEFDVRPYSVKDQILWYGILENDNNTEG